MWWVPGDVPLLLERLKFVPARNNWCSEHVALCKRPHNCPQKVSSIVYWLQLVDAHIKPTGKLRVSERQLINLDEFPKYCRTQLAVICSNIMASALSLGAMATVGRPDTAALRSSTCVRWMFTGKLEAYTGWSADLVLWVWVYWTQCTINGCGFHRFT